MALLITLSAGFAAVPVLAAHQKTYVTAATDKGKIRGCRENGIDSYKGIPYAKPPIGKLRWKSPQPAEAWSGVKDCTRYGPSGIQDDQKVAEPYTEEFVIDTKAGYSEDCLNLNVWTKNDGQKNKPVIVYIHGGAFVSGGSSCEVYKGNGLAGKDAVFVSLNYRLGLFGFYANPELSKESADGTSGNYALQDILLGLQWVKRNAETFGGDGSNITLIGQSAGACLTELLAASPKARGLISKAVILSYPQYGSTCTPLKTAETRGKAAAGGESIEKLRNLSSQEALSKLGRYWFPIQDGSIVTGSTKTSYSQGTANDIPIIYGSVPGDILFVLGGVTSHDPKEKLMAASVIPGLLDQPNAITDRERNTLMTLYLSAAAARNKTLKSHTYIVFFSHVLPGPKSAENGAFHTSDVPYWLNNLVDSRKDYWTAEDRTIADRMSDYLLQFARNGNPNGAGIPGWDPYSGKFTFLLIESAETMKMADIKNQNYWQNIVRERIEG